jgi:hypothetical protein
MDVHPALTYRDADAGFLTWHSAVLRALKLRTGFAVSSLMLTAHPRPGSSASHRYSGRSVEKDRGDHLATARIRAVSRRVSFTTQQPSAADAIPFG